MANPPPQRRESAWLTLRQLADALDLSLTHVRREVLRAVPADMQRRTGNRIEVYGRGAIEIWIRRQQLAALDNSDFDDLVDEYYESVRSDNDDPQEPLNPPTESE